MDNGVVQVTVSKPDGFVTGISYHGIDNLLEIRNEEYDRGYVKLIRHICVYISNRLYIHACCDQTQVLGPCLERRRDGWNHREI